MHSQPAHPALVCPPGGAFPCQDNGACWGPRGAATPCQMGMTIGSERWLLSFSAHTHSA